MEALPLVPLHSPEGCGVRPPPEVARGSLGDGGDTQSVRLSGMGLFSLPWLPSRALQLPWERRIGVKKRHHETAKKGPGFAPVRGAGSGGGHVGSAGCGWVLGGQGCPLAWGQSPSCPCKSDFHGRFCSVSSAGIWGR